MLILLCTHCVGIMVGHVTPEAFDGGPIALVEEGDVVVIDLQNKKLDVVSKIFIHDCSVIVFFCSWWTTLCLLHVVLSGNHQTCLLLDC